MPLTSTTPRPMSEVLAELRRPGADGSGVYLLFFRAAEGLLIRTLYSELESHALCRVGDYSLMYVGSTQNSLARRIWHHFKCDSRASSLRTTVASIVGADLDLTACRIGRSQRCHFGDSEKRLSAWMVENAKVAYFKCERPLFLEASLIHLFAPPFNISRRRGHGYAKHLMSLRGAFGPRARFPHLPAGVVLRRNLKKIRDRNS